MRSGPVALLAVVAAGLALLAMLALTHGSALVYTLGIQPQLAVANLRPGDIACQAPIRLPRGTTFERVGLNAAGGRDLEVTVRDPESGRTFRRGVAAPARPPAVAGPPPVVTAAVAPLRTEGPLTVCAQNRGSAPTALWGTVDTASGDTSASLNGRSLGQDLSVRFERAHEQSLLVLAPKLAERASLFRARWLSPLAYAALAALLLVAVPALLCVALRAAVRP